VLETIEIFGIDRVMFGSNLPDRRAVQHRSTGYTRAFLSITPEFQ